MRPLPKVPRSITREYMLDLVSRIQEELFNRRPLLEGKLYAADDKPLIVLVDGVEYELGVDVIPPMAGDELDPLLRDSNLNNNGGTILEENTSGVAIQHAFASTGAVVSTTSPIPYDDTIPQITEGGEALSTAFTPKRADSRIRIVANLQIRGDTTDRVRVAAVFIAGTNDALAVADDYEGSGAGTPAIGSVTVIADIASPGITAQTFSARFAIHSTGTAYLNASSDGTRRFGGAYASTLEITEYMP